MPDHRSWSTTLSRLHGFVRLLERRDFSTASVRELQLELKRIGYYPARDLPDLCQPQLPDVFFTYHSAQPLTEIAEIVRRVLERAGDMLLHQRPELTQADVAPLLNDYVRIWVDFLFIDQSARDIREELEVLPHVLERVGAHFVLGDQPLSRAWCCYEIALFNQHLVQHDALDLAGNIAPGLRSYVAPTTTLYRGWPHTNVTEPQDKAFIGASISSSFPGGFEGFNHVMQQANAMGVLTVTEHRTYTPPAADAMLARNVAAWYDRMTAESA